MMKELKGFEGKTIARIDRDEYNLNMIFTDGTNLLFEAGHTDEEIHLFANGTPHDHHANTLRELKWVSE